MSNSKTISSVEYYSSCPSCGAINNGKKFCEYCGASMIKKSVQEISNTNLEDEYLNEDATLPLIKGKNCGSNPFMTLFCSIFGGMFVLVPTIICIVFCSVGLIELWLIPFFGLFWIIGFGALTPLIISIVNRNKCKNGRHITGIVRGYEDSMIMVNNRPVKNVRILLEDNGYKRILLISTGTSNCRYAIGRTVHLINYKDYYIFE